MSWMFQSKAFNNKINQLDTKNIKNYVFEFYKYI